MGIHTPIPETGSYGLVIVVIYCLCCPSLAAHIRLRLLGATVTSFVLIYGSVMGFVIAWGLLIFDAKQIFGNSVPQWLLSIPLGIVAGVLAGRSDRAIVRYFFRRRVGLRNALSTRRGQAVFLARSSYFPMAGPSRKRKVLALPQVQGDLRSPSEDRDFGAVLLVVIAGLEEVIFRGLLVRACLLLPNWFLVTIALGGSVAMFALSHVQFGWPQVFAKLSLGALLMITVLVLRTVLPAVIAHGIFNLQLWSDKRNQPAFLRS